MGETVSVAIRGFTEERRLMQQKAVKVLAPYQLFCRNNYFGEVELLLDRSGPRRCCVRCESERGGSLLVLNKQGLYDILDEFPRTKGIWRSSAIRRESYRQEL